MIARTVDGIRGSAQFEHLALVMVREGKAGVALGSPSLLGKLELRDRVPAVVLAYESGLAKPGGR